MPSPLTKYQRQPKQSIDLPSKGRWYSQGSLEKSEELEVFSMTASNEIATKTPDTLLSGNTTVDIIKSCVPSIRNPWEIPLTDIYTILGVIRMASYGSSINAKNTCTECTGWYLYPWFRSGSCNFSLPKDDKKLDQKSFLNFKFINPGFNTLN